MRELVVRVLGYMGRWSAFEMGLQAFSSSGLSFVRARLFLRLIRALFLGISVSLLLESYDMYV